MYSCRLKSLIGYCVDSVLGYLTQKFNAHLALFLLQMKNQMNKQRRLDIEFDFALLPFVGSIGLGNPNTKENSLKKCVNDGIE